MGNDGRNGKANWRFLGPSRDPDAVDLWRSLEIFILEKISEDFCRH
jgi:hypothetical protein